MAERITVKRTVNGTVVPDKVIDCGHASVSMSAAIGEGVAAIDFTGCPTDSEGWQLVYAAYTGVISVTRMQRVEQS